MSGVEIQRSSFPHAFAGFGKRVVTSALSYSADADAAQPDPGWHGAAGEALHAARMATEMTIEDFAIETRIPMRVLRAIENCDFTDPLARPGAVAFSRAFARRFGVSEYWVEVEVREALSRVGQPHYTPIAAIEENRDRARALAIAGGLFVVFVATVSAWGAWLLS